MLKLIIVMIAAMVSQTHTKPVMVSFGTKQGAIVPAAPRSTTLNPLAPRNAAPVFEKMDDVPNPVTYKPPSSEQYRHTLYSYKPSPNLILGTPLDIKYALSQAKFDLYDKKAKYAKSVGLQYNGPHQFDIQDYEIERELKKKQALNSRTQNFVQQYNTQQQVSSTNQQQQVDQNQQVQPKVEEQQGNNQEQNSNSNQQQQNYQVREPVNQQSSSYQYHYQNKAVPEIGIVYSSGVRYYVPQIYYYNEESENSVYDKNEPKYYYQQN